MRIRLIIFAACLAVSGLFAPAVRAQEESEPRVPPRFERGQVIGIDDTLASVRLLTGPDKGEVIVVDGGPASVFFEDTPQKIRKGDVLVIGWTPIDGEPTPFIADHYRLPSVFGAGALFLVLIFLLSRWKGLGALAGLLMSVGAILFWFLPAVAEGADPLPLALITAFGILLVSMYAAHGWERRTHVAMGGALVSLLAAVVAALLFTAAAKLFGTGSEESFYLQIGPLADLDLRNLLLAGVILGAVGVLDDVTTGQSAAVEEIHLADPTLSRHELVIRGLRVGREHVASLVNTLFLAYAGVSLPLFLLFKVNAAAPFWVLANSEFVVEEVMRTLVGSAALIAAVPITTLLSAYVLTRKKQRT